MKLAIAMLPLLFSPVAYAQTQDYVWTGIDDNGNSAMGAFTVNDLGPNTGSPGGGMFDAVTNVGFSYQGKSGNDLGGGNGLFSHEDASLIQDENIALQGDLTGDFAFALLAAPGTFASPNPVQADNLQNAESGRWGFQSHGGVGPDALEVAGQILKVYQRADFSGNLSFNFGGGGNTCN